MTTLILFWTLILKTIDELNHVSSPVLSLEMLVVRLLHIRDAPSYEKILDSLKENNSNETNEANNIPISPKNEKKIILISPKNKIQ